MVKCDVNWVNKFQKVIEESTKVGKWCNCFWHRYRCYNRNFALEATKEHDIGFKTSLVYKANETNFVDKGKAVVENKSADEIKIWSTTDLTAANSIDEILKYLSSASQRRI